MRKYVKFYYLFLFCTICFWMGCDTPLTDRNHTYKTVQEYLSKNKLNLNDNGFDWNRLENSFWEDADRKIIKSVRSAQDINTAYKSIKANALLGNEKEIINIKGNTSTAITALEKEKNRLLQASDGKAKQTFAVFLTEVMHTLFHDNIENIPPSKKRQFYAQFYKSRKEKVPEYEGQNKLAWILGMFSTTFSNIFLWAPLLLFLWLFSAWVIQKRFFSDANKVKKNLLYAYAYSPQYFVKKIKSFSNVRKERKVEPDGSIPSQKKQKAELDWKELSKSPEFEKEVLSIIVNKFKPGIKKEFEDVYDRIEEIEESIKPSVNPNQKENNNPPQEFNQEKIVTLVDQLLKLEYAPNLENLKKDIKNLKEKVNNPGNNIYQTYEALKAEYEKVLRFKEKGIENDLANRISKALDNPTTTSEIKSKVKSIISQQIKNKKAKLQDQDSNNMSIGLSGYMAGAELEGKLENKEKELKRYIDEKINTLELQTRQTNSKRKTKTSGSKELTEEQVNVITELIAIGIDSQIAAQKNQIKKVEKKLTSLSDPELLGNRNDELDNTIKDLRNEITYLKNAYKEIQKDLEKVNMDVRAKGLSKQTAHKETGGYYIAEEAANIRYSSRPENKFFYESKLTTTCVPSESLYKIHLIDSTTAKYEIITDVNSIKFALNMPDVYIAPGAESVGDGSLKDASYIRTEKLGDLIKANNHTWKIRNKTVIYYE